MAGNAGTAERPVHRAVLGLLALLPAAALGIAFLIEFIGGIAPCHLCITERWVYLAAIVAALVGLVTGHLRLALAVAILILLGNAAVSGYHVAIEQGLVALPGSCVAGTDAASLDDLRNQLMNARPTCDQAPIHVLGLSLAAWNGLFALACASLGLWGLRRPAGR